MMRKLGNRLIGDEQNFTFEQRIYNFVMLLSVCLATFGSLLDIYYGVGVWIDLMFTGCWMLTYYFSRFHAHFDIVSKISIGIFIFAYFPYYWMSSGGISGTIPCFTVIFMAILCLILNGEFRIIMTVSMLAVTVLLICGDIYHNGSPENVTNLILSGVQIMFVMVAMAILTLFYSGIHIREKAKSEAYARALEENYLQQSYYMKNMEDLTDRLTSERYDFNHHLDVIYGLLESGDADNAGKYASQLVKAAGEVQNLVNVPYPMVSAMLGYKLAAAKKNDIRLKLHVVIPEGLALPEFDLTVILGNLLDNAVEACMTIGEGDRYIGLNMFYKPDYLIIQTENPVSVAPEPPHGSSETTKPDAENHGYGLRNMEYLTRKHNGFMKTTRENGVFRADVALLIDPVPCPESSPSSL